ncbi:hypothetical protein [Chlorogloeopsis fritschii]|uniref:hypothetical protein n=1 Tax=Chlorogloeopsis fritschii TaxID=1124 RepID=UPI0023F3F00A|nr:hypothetical protein [Chlorogloeopsis fritschii]
MFELTYTLEVICEIFCDWSLVIVIGHWLVGEAARPWRLRSVECDCRGGFADYFSAQTDHLSSKPARTYIGKNYIRDF